jgi:hypothetical protein
MTKKKHIPLKSQFSWKVIKEKSKGILRSKTDNPEKMMASDREHRQEMNCIIKENSKLRSQMYK